MKVYEIRGMNADEVHAKMKELQSEIARERALIASGTRPENPGRIRAVRKTIARMLTVLHERKESEVLETTGKKVVEEKVHTEKKEIVQKKVEKKTVQHAVSKERGSKNAPSKEKTKKSKGKK